MWWWKLVCRQPPIQIVSKIEICTEIKAPNKNVIQNAKYLCVSIRTGAAVFRGGHLALNPCSEVRDPAVDSVLPCQSALLSKACFTNQNMLCSALVGQRTARVSLPKIFGLFQKIFQKIFDWDLTAILACHSTSTDHVVSDCGKACHGGGAGLLRHHGHLQLHQDVWIISSPVWQCTPA